MLTVRMSEDIKLTMEYCQTGCGDGNGDDGGKSEAEGVASTVVEVWERRGGGEGPVGAIRSTSCDSNDDHVRRTWR